MRFSRPNSKPGSARGRHRRDERGVVIVLVAVFMLFVVGAMAALSIDLVTLYTARSEAQLAADGAALAAARVIANSGVTSGTAAPAAGEDPLAKSIAIQVATKNFVGGVRLVDADVAVSFKNTSPNDPQVTVKINTTVPTFFARIWGNRQVAIGASATAEAYNPTPAPGAPVGGAVTPVAPLCVKPWLLPNLDPTGTVGGAIFDPVGGAVMPTATGLVGQSWPSTAPGANANGLYARCQDCSLGIPAPSPGAYYPGAIDAADFPAPSLNSSPSCAAAFNPYQLAVAGCVQLPIACGPVATASVNIDVTNLYSATRDTDTEAAAECLVHYNGAAGDSDSIDPTTPLPPFEFYGGAQNPVAGAVSHNIMVSDSLVTIPVIDTGAPPGVTPATSVNIIGFLQMFLNSSATYTMPYFNPAKPATPEIRATIVNMAGCGTGATGTPIYGNGASPVAVRLVSP